MKKCLLLACVAGAASLAVAQDQFWNGSDLTPVRVAPTEGGGYGQRVTPVWSNGTFPGVNIGFFGGLYDMLDDISFVGTPWAGATGRTITQMNFGIGQFVGLAGTNTCDVHFDFYDATVVDAAGGGFANTVDMLSGITPFATYQFAFTNQGQGIYSWFTNGVSIAIPDGTDRVYVRWWIGQPGTSTVWTGVAPFVGNAFIPGVANNLTVGQGTTSIGWNTVNLNVPPYFTGGDPRCSGAAGTSEHRQICTSGAINGVGHYLVLSGELVLNDPAGMIDLSSDGASCLPDAGQTVTPTLAANGVQYYRICLGNDATDGLEQFLDLDSIGSSGDTSIAMWTRPDGALVSDDLNDGGNGGAGLMTFGIGRRNGSGDSTQFDGRDGELLAGDYIVAIATGDAAFGPAYAAVASGPGGSASLNMRTNVNGTPAAASVPPALEGTPFDLGDLTQLAVAPPAADMDTGWVVWYRFEVCSEVANDGNDTAEGPYLDFDFSGSFAGSDTQVFVFDSATGAAVYGDDDSGPGFFSQLSWGDVSPPRPAVGDGLPFAGQNGTLPAGEYYMAVGLFGVVPSTNPRWHARSTSGSSLPAQFIPFFAGIEACSACPACAADYNQDGGVDGPDVEAFYFDWENSLPCADVNQDGGIDGPDVEAFFTVWENGGCD